MDVRGIKHFGGFYFILSFKYRYAFTHPDACHDYDLYEDGHTQPHADKFSDFYRDKDSHAERDEQFFAYSQPFTDQYPRYDDDLYYYIQLYFHADSQPFAERKRNTVLYRDKLFDIHADTHGHPHIYAKHFRHPDRHPVADLYIYAHRHYEPDQKRHADRYDYFHGYGDQHGDQDKFKHAKPVIYGHFDPYLYGYLHCHSDTDPDKHSQFHAVGHRHLYMDIDRDRNVHHNHYVA